jgi:hypothetical protein
MLHARNLRVTMQISVAVLWAMFKMGTGEAHTASIFPYIPQFVGLGVILECRQSRGIGE